MPNARQVVVVSDLHIDTWRQSESGARKRDAFIAFLAEIEPVTSELYIVGDLLDIPPYEFEQADLVAQFGDVMRALVDFGASTRVFWLIGNHDIGLCGARVLLPNITIWYPSICYRPPNNSEMRIILEHGHLHDRLLSLYAKDLALLSYYGDAANQPLTERSDLINRMLQRREREGSTAYQPGLLTQKKRGGVFKWVKRECAEIVEDIYSVRHWRDQATIAARQHSNISEKPIDAIVFGHTHCPDFADIKWKETGKYRYYNTGSWTESEPCMPYLVIAEDGAIQRRCYGLKDRSDLTVDQCGPSACLYAGKH